jgi:hypothetical protein
MSEAFFMMAAARLNDNAFDDKHPTAAAEPSDAVKASAILMELLQLGMNPREVERRAWGAQRLSKAYSSIPSHARRAAKNPDYWNILYASRVNSLTNDWPGHSVTD